MADRRRRRRRARPRRVGLPEAQRHRSCAVGAPRRARPPIASWWPPSSRPTGSTRTARLGRRRPRSSPTSADAACSSSDAMRARRPCASLRRIPRDARCRRSEILTTLHVLVVLIIVVEVLIRVVPLPRLSRVLGVAVDLAPSPGRRDQLPRARPARASPPSAALHAQGRRRLAVQRGAVPAPVARRRPPAARARPRGPPRPDGIRRRAAAPTRGSRSTAGRWRPSTDYAAFERSAAAG